MLDTWNKCCKTAKYDECNNYYRPRSSRDKLPDFSTKPIRFLGPAHFFTFFSSSSSIISSGRGTNGIKANRPSKAKIAGSKVSAAIPMIKIDKLNGTAKRL